ncbi:hypothetical protein ACFVTT_38570 [Streptomyces niveus]|uniref:hypothetical protein n=1 Tax=Streptomyces niveus TaxID=193462 RepID=UPI00343CA07E
MDITTAAALTTIALRWADLRDALTTHNTAWPPAGRADILRALGEQDPEPEFLGLIEHGQRLITTHRNGRPWYECAHCEHVGPGRLHHEAETGHPLRRIAAPIHLDLVDVMDAVHAELVDCAAAVAEHVQRPPMPMPAPRRAAYARTRADRIAWEDHARRVRAAQDDAVDPRRWKWTGTRPDAPYAALWLLGRIQGAPGPFRPLGDPQQRHIATVARTAASRVEQALDITGQVALLAPPCPDCGGTVQMHGGAGAAPVAHCTSCGRVWAEQPIAA